MKKIITPTNLRSDLFNVIKSIINDKEEIIITTKEKDDIVMISKTDYDEILETLELISAGVDKVIEERKDSEIITFSMDMLD